AVGRDRHGHARDAGARLAGDSRAEGMRMRTIHFWPMLLGAALALSPAAHAQDYPAKPIRIVIPFPPGGGVDLLARLIGDKVQAKWGQPVISENRAGAN